MLTRQTFGYGDSFTADDFPEAPKKDGCYADWNVTDLSDLRFDTTVTAVYTPYNPGIASAAVREDGRAILMAEGTLNQALPVTIPAAISVEPTPVENAPCAP